MSDRFVLAVHTKTHILQRVPEHYIETFPYLKLASKEQIEQAKAPKPLAVEKPKLKEGEK